LKKFISALASLGLMLMSLVALSFIAAPAANAGDSPNIAICHATSSETNPFESITVSKTSIVKEAGHGAHEGDIIPSFTYAEKKGDPLITYPGKNWTAEGKAIYGNSCVKPLTVVAPVPPTYSPGTCINPTGTVNLPTQPEGVTLNFGPTLDGNIWKVSYVPAEGYKFATETAGIFAFTVVGPDASDPQWDAETNGCGLPEVGAGDLTSYLPYGLGLLALGGAFALIGARRRKTA